MILYNRYLNIAISLIIITTVISFYPCLENGFTNWDDEAYVTQNPDIQKLSRENIKKIFSTPYVNMYLPITMLSYTLEYHFFKSGPFIYHLTSFLLHIFNSILVFYLIFIITENTFTAFLTGILFAIHPVHVESVAWISERKDVLSTFFFLLSFIFYIYYLKRQNIRYYCLSIVIIVLSLLSKPIAITFPVILILCDYYFEKNINLKNKLPYFLLSIIFLAISFVTQKSSIMIQTGYNTIDNIFVAFYGLVFYLYKIIIPLNLSCFYPYPVKVDNFLPYYFYMAPFIILFLVLLIVKIHNKKVIFGSLFFLITILPVIKLLPLSDAITADRYTYMSSIGLFYLTGEGFLYIYGKAGRVKTLLIIIPVIIICSMSFLTYNRTMVWKDSVTLWDDVLKNYPGSYKAFNGRGNGYIVKGEYDKGISDLNEALRLKPDYEDAFYNRGCAYIERGDLHMAINDFSDVIRINPKNFEAYNNRGGVYMQQGEYKKALEDFSKAILLNPDYDMAYYNRSYIYFKKGYYKKAWNDVKNLERLGCEVNNDFIKALKEALKRKY